MSHNSASAPLAAPTNAKPLPPGFWLPLETVLGGAALPTTWKLQLGPDFDAFNALFLKARPDQQADFVPCPWNCGCFHKVVLAPNGTLHGLCQCDPPNCGIYTVMPDERIPLELDWPRLAQVLSHAFGFQAKLVKLGLYNTLQLGAWSADGLPVVLTLASNRPEFLNTVTALQARFGQPFILLAPTSRHLTPAAKELLAGIGAAFFALEDHLLLGTRSTASETLPGKNGDGPASAATQFELVSATPPAKLFVDLAPLRPDPSDEDLARRAFLALQEPDHNARTRPPTLYTVFQLYCVKGLTIPQIARKCRCSIGTVANRLKFLHRKTGVTTRRLRGVTPHFVRFEDGFGQAERNYRLRSHHRAS